MHFVERVATWRVEPGGTVILHLLPAEPARYWPARLFRSRVDSRAHPLVIREGSCTAPATAFELDGGVDSLTLSPGCTYPATDRLPAVPPDIARGGGRGRAHRPGGVAQCWRAWRELLAGVPICYFRPVHRGDKVGAGGLSRGPYG